MSTHKQLNLPAILVANDLRLGEVVFAAQGGWSANLRDATTALDQGAAGALEAFGAAETRACKVLDPYLVEVELDADGAPAPKHYRERLRALGPSHRPDLGKQAQFPGAFATFGGEV